jgi:1-phosphatidylinositol-3-phosphate 5-kinase
LSLNAPGHEPLFPRFETLLATLCSLAVEDDSGQLWVPPPPDSDEEEVAAEDDHGGGDEDATEEGGWDGEDDEDDDWERERARRRRRLRRNSRTAKPSEMHKKVLRSVSDDHFRALVSQLLSTEGLPLGTEGDTEGWLDIIASLASRAAGMIRPSPNTPGPMDPGLYIKVKCIATGTKGDSDVVKGVVCRKNVAHRRMSHPKRNARLLLWGGALEYQRLPNQLSSLEQVLQQEREHLNALVARVERHKPDVLLVEKAVSGYAQERLLASQISLVSAPAGNYVCINV